MDQEDRKAKITSMIDQIESWTVPIFTKDDRNIPSLLGTGILINAGVLKLLLTAKHVIDDDNQGLFIPSNERLKGIIAKVHFTSMKYSDLLDQKTAIDACICVLEEDTAEWVNSSFIFAEMGNHLVLGQPFMDQSCIILGYPKTKTNRDKKKKTIANQLFPIYSDITEIYRSSSGDIISFDVRFRKDHKHQSPRFAPDPYGMSGCGIWNVSHPNNIESKYSTNELLGIAIEYYASKQRIKCVPLSLMPWVDLGIIG